MTKKSEWDKMSPDEKFEALRVDVNRALDSTDDLLVYGQKLEDRIKQLNEALHMIGKQVFEVRQKLSKKLNDSF